MESVAEPYYLSPYLNAAKRHGAGFESLLWASPATQAARFTAIRRLCDLETRSVLDVGCGRADLLDYLLHHHMAPADYIGIEAVEDLADAAEGKRHPRCTILRADFVQEPRRMFVGAEVVVFCGSLNTLDTAAFYATLRHAFEATADVLVFNFLSSWALAGKKYLTWHQPADVLRFAEELSPRVRLLDDYMPGDCTLAVRKAP